MIYKIYKRNSNEILIEGEANSFKEFVEKNKANLTNANLTNAKIKISQKDDILKVIGIEIVI